MVTVSACERGRGLKAQKYKFQCKEIICGVSRQPHDLILVLKYGTITPGRENLKQVKRNVYNGL